MHPTRIHREIQAALAAIRDETRVIQQLAPAGSELSRTREEIDRQVHQLSRLVDDLLSRVGPGREPLPEEPELDTRQKVLVADDNRDSAESLGMLLELAGHEVRLAYNGEEALALAASFRPRVLLLDIGLPKLDGFEVAARLRQDSAHDGMLLVAVTGYGTDSDRSRSRAAGFDHHLVKPVDPDALKDLIANACREVTA
jgi:CheY-like chemotaxis protein